MFFIIPIKTELDLKCIIMTCKKVVKINHLNCWVWTEIVKIIIKRAIFFHGRLQPNPFFWTSGFSVKPMMHITPLGCQFGLILLQNLGLLEVYSWNIFGSGSNLGKPPYVKYVTRWVVLRPIASFCHRNLGKPCSRGRSTSVPDLDWYIGSKVTHHTGSRLLQSQQLGEHFRSWSTLD